MVVAVEARGWGGGGGDVATAMCHIVTWLNHTSHIRSLEPVQ